MHRSSGPNLKEPMTYVFLLHPHHRFSRGNQGKEHKYTYTHTFQPAYPPTDLRTDLPTDLSPCLPDPPTCLSSPLLTATAQLEKSLAYILGNLANKCKTMSNFFNEKEAQGTLTSACEFLVLLFSMFLLLPPIEGLRFGISRATHGKTPDEVEAPSLCQLTTALTH